MQITLLHRVNEEYEKENKRDDLYATAVQLSSASPLYRILQWLLWPHMHV